MPAIPVSLKMPYPMADNSNAPASGPPQLHLMVNVDGATGNEEIRRMLNEGVSHSIEQSGINAHRTWPTSAREWQKRA